VVYKNQAGEAQTVHLRVEGPVCVAGYTTKESVYEDSSNWSFFCTWMKVRNRIKRNGLKELMVMLD
jgi:hypothetical protein